MNYIRDISIKRKLILSFGLICGVAVFSSLLSLYMLTKVSGETVQINEKWLPGVKTLDQMHSQHSVMQRAYLNFIICDSESCKQRYSEAYHTAKNNLHTGFRQYQSLITTDEERQLLSHLNDLVGSYEAKCEHSWELFAAGKSEEAERIRIDQCRPAYDEAYKTGDEVIAMYNKGADEATAHAIALSRTARILLLVALVCIIVVGVLATKLLTALIAKPLKEASDILGRVAQKDLSHTFDFQSEDEVGQMAVSLNTTIQNMREILGRIMTGSNQLAESTESIAAIANQSAQGARNQSAQLQQSASATQEMAAVVANISENSEKAASATRDSAEQAEEGGRIVSEVVKQFDALAKESANATVSMQALNQHSDEIGKVVGVIRDIADQTNLLALNAAIESARAGEHGRGFAVVASEVRRLAERTRESTEEITRMVELVQSRTKEAVQSSTTSNDRLQGALVQVQEAGQALHAIVESAKGSEHLVSLIATATTQQRAAAQEVSEGLSAIARGSSEATASAEKSSEACRTLTTLANDLAVTVKEFHLDQNEKSYSLGTGLPAKKMIGKAHAW